MSLSHHQKQQMLSTLTSYLAGHDNLKKVINSPCLDHHGKLLSRDGTKVFTANNNYNGRGGGNRQNKRNKNGGGHGGKKSRGNQHQKKSKGSNNQVFNLSVLISYF